MLTQTNTLRNTVYRFRRFFFTQENITDIPAHLLMYIRIHTTYPALDNDSMTFISLVPQNKYNTEELLKPKHNEE